MTTREVVVFELQPRWVPELQREFAGEDVTVRGCRSPDDIWAWVSQNPITIVITDMRAAAAQCLQFLGRTVLSADPPPVIVISPQQTADLEWTVRELGALEFMIGNVPGYEVARLCRRQWKKKQSQPCQKAGNV